MQTSTNVYINNTADNELVIYITSLQSIRFLPGINCISAKEYDKLKNLETFERYADIGLLEERVLKKDLTIEEDTQLGVTDDDDEPVLVVHSVNGHIQPMLMGGFKKFTKEDMRAAGVPRILGSSIIKHQPALGWKDAQAIADGLAIDPQSEEYKKIQLLFV
jgi:hypothetical protein